MGCLAQEHVRGKNTFGSGITEPLGDSKEKADAFALWIFQPQNSAIEPFASLPHQLIFNQRHAMVSYWLFELKDRNEFF